MKQRIATIIDEIKKRMQNQLAGEEFDAAKISDASKLLTRAAQLQDRIEKDEQEMSEIEAIIKEPPMPAPSNSTPNSELKHENGYEKAGRAAPQTLRVKIDWNANGVNKPPEEISMPKAADVMARVMARLHEVLGPVVFQKLAHFPVNRGPLLSQSPNKDFGGYQYKLVPSTKHFILTHSSTPEKVLILEKVFQVLGMKPGSVEITTQSRHDQLMSELEDY